MKSLRTLIFCLIGLSPILHAQEKVYDCKAQSTYIVKILHSTGVSGKSTLKSNFLSDELDKISKVIDLFEYAESDLLEKDWYKLNNSYNNLHLALKYRFDSGLNYLILANFSVKRKLNYVFHNFILKGKKTALFPLRVGACSIIKAGILNRNSHHGLERLFRTTSRLNTLNRHSTGSYPATYSPSFAK